MTLIGVPHIFYFPGKGRKVSEYYKKQERLLEGFGEMEMINEGCFPDSLTAVESGILESN